MYSELSDETSPQDLELAVPMQPQIDVDEKRTKQLRFHVTLLEKEQPSRAGVWERSQCEKELGVPFRELKNDLASDGSLVIVMRKGAAILKVAGLSVVVRGTLCGIVRSVDHGLQPEQASKAQIFENKIEEIFKSPSEILSLDILEYFLDLETQSLTSDYMEVTNRKSGLVQARVPNVSLEVLQERTLFKRQIKVLLSRLEGLSNDLSAILDSEDDMMALGSTDEKKLEEVESMIEYFDLKISRLLRDVNNLKEEFDNFETDLRVQLDFVRNQIIRIEMLLTIGTFSVTVCAVITGIFGMNLKSHFEDHLAAFWIVVVGVIIAGILFCSLLAKLISKRGIYLYD